MSSASGSQEVMTLDSPDSFYKFILQEIPLCRDNIKLAALYFGVGEHEKRIVETLSASLKDSSRPKLTVECMFDYHRSSRDQFGSLQLLKQLKLQYPNRFHIHFFKSKTELTSLSLDKRITRSEVLETFGVFHSKFCVFDKKVLLTGANLSTDYFTTRQDRYWVVNPQHNADASSSLWGFLSRFQQVVSPHCYWLSESGEVMRPPVNESHRLGKDLLSLMSSYSNSIRSANGTTVFVPLVQLSSHRVQHESASLLSYINDLTRNAAQKTLSSLLSIPTLHHQPELELTVAISTPYPSFSNELCSSLGSLNSFKNVSMKLLIPSSEAHGFSNGRGIKAWIPALHKAAFQNAIDAIRSTSAKLTSDSSKRNELAIVQFTRPDWTFHVKGVWAFVAAKGSMLAHWQQSEQPVLMASTYIGSSNLGQRSWDRDFELGFLVTSTDQQIVTILRNEHHQLVQCATPIALHSHQKRIGDKWMNIFLRVIAKMIKTFL